MFALSRHSLRASRCTSSSLSFDDTNADPNCEIVMIRSSSPDTIERDVSSRGSSNDVGSARIYFLTERKVSISSNQQKMTHESKIPKDMLIGELSESWRGTRGAFREQVVRFVSGLYVACGRVAAHHIQQKESFQTVGPYGLFLRAATMASNVASNAFPS